MPSDTLTPGPVIEVRGLTKHFGAVQAVRDLTFTVEPGRVTGFLGPNGSGKTTSLRMLLGLVEPTRGTATIGGHRYVDLPDPGRVVGASLEASFHPGRTARGHLATLAPLVGADRARIQQVLELVGLAEAADRRTLGFSLGMKQRLGLASTLLGDPSVLVLDEPINGLDPEGIVWLRELLRRLADEGRTVLLSSHVLGEVQATVDDVVMIAKGRLIHSSTLAEFTGLATPKVWVKGPDAAGLTALADRAGWAYTPRFGGLEIDDVRTDEVGGRAFAAGLEIHALQSVGASLEQTFLDLVRAAEADEHNAPMGRTA